MISKKIRQVNKQLKDTLTKEKFVDRVTDLVKEGMVEIVDCEEDGCPIVTITDKGMEVFLNEAIIGDA
jgi:DNA-binding MarR family transcriptional regulator